MIFLTQFCVIVTVINFVLIFKGEVLVCVNKMQYKY